MVWHCWYLGGRIDHGHHDTKSRRALEETVMFDDTVQVACDLTSEKNTLVIVTADHSHVFTIGGRHPKRGNDILGVLFIFKLECLLANKIWLNRLQCGQSLYLHILIYNLTSNLDKAIRKSNINIRLIFIYIPPLPKK